MLAWRLACILGFVASIAFPCSAAAVGKPPRTAKNHHRARRMRGHSQQMVIDVGKIEDKMQKLASLVMFRDFSTMDTSVYLNYDPNKSTAENAKSSFNYFVKEMNLVKELTKAELGRYLERFVMKMEALAKSDKLANITDPEEQDNAWKVDVADTLEGEKPAVTKSVVDALNQADIGWKAQDSTDLENVTIGDVRGFSGVRLPSADIEKIHRKARECKNGTNATNTTNLMRTPDYDMPDTFDARENWTNCAEVLGSVRNQGQCGSCWAMASASAVGGRICITSDGAFSGDSAFLSAGYMTSCASDQGACQGGEPLTALQWMGVHGVPTGGSGSNLLTCVPYFGNGDSMKHFVDPSQAPPCPTSCTSGMYPRSLQEDMFIPQGLKDSAHSSVCDAKQAMANEGPVVIIFEVYQDFMSYQGGVYTPASRNLQGYHATVAIGYGPDYILAVNSWGESWGMDGLFKIHEEAVLGFVVPGNIKGDGVGYPFPIPGGVLPSLFLWGTWRLLQGTCSISSNGCLESPNFPEGYGNSKRCTFYADEGSPSLSVEYFNTEQDADVLIINNVSFSGSKGPEGIQPKGEIVWSSDDSVDGPGWRLCPRTDVASSLQKSNAQQGVYSVSLLRHACIVIGLLAAVARSLNMILD